MHDYIFPNTFEQFFGNFRQMLHIYCNAVPTYCHMQTSSVQSHVTSAYKFNLKLSNFYLFTQVDFGSYWRLIREESWCLIICYLPVICLLNPKLAM